jgi:O6-methylguanine-DNA--protein-cysteine methyltransferase
VEYENFAIYETNLGFIRIDYENDVITYLKQVAENLMDFGTKNEITDKVYHQLFEYFEGKRKTFDFKYELRGTDFQKQVWSALCDIPYGETRTY